METIKGKEIFFNFIEVDYNDGKEKYDLIEKIDLGELDGFVTRGVLSKEEVNNVLEKTKLINEAEFLRSSTGKTFPYPYATISNNNDKLDEYIRKNELFDELPFGFLKDRLATFFNKFSGNLTAKVPMVLKTKKEGSPANFRFYMPNMGGLFVHCGYFFQEAHAYAFEEVQDMDKVGQLSFFLALQYPEKGGELTIYDMLWPEVNAKDSFEENNYVLNNKGEKIYLKDVRTFTVRPEPGDILVFRGGTIWHRVESIHGNNPRISFGGFINFSKDRKEFYYWG